MEYRTLGRTGLKVSLMSFGSGGPSNLGQKTGLSQPEQDTLIRKCLDLGVNLIDTSEFYGRSEEILGKALSGIPRDSYHLATKWVYHNDERLDKAPGDLTKALENSLKRLATDHVEIMQFHGVMPEHYRHVVDRHYPELKRLQEQGKVGFIGMTVRFFFDATHEGAAMAMREDPELWDTIMLKYGILNQYAAKEILPLALQHNVGVLNMATVREKLPNPALLEALIADWKSRGFITKDSLSNKDPLGWLVHDDVDSVISAAYKFGADHPAISTVLTGTASVHHLETNSTALEHPYLPESDKERLIELFSEVAEYA